jgi:hypothetical protein
MSGPINPCDSGPPEEGRTIPTCKRTLTLHVARAYSVSSGDLRSLELIRVRSVVQVYPGPPFDFLPSCSFPSPPCVARFRSPHSAPHQRCPRRSAGSRSRAQNTSAPLRCPQILVRWHHAPVAQLDRASGFEDCVHEESTSCTERYELLPRATIAAFTRVCDGARPLGSTR